jgi:chemotaxis signal transduction protein
MIDKEMDLREATARVAAPVAAEEAKGEVAFIFRMNEEWYALPAASCDRVVDQSRTHSVPHRKGTLIGVGNIAGDLLPVISLPTLLGIGSADTATNEHRTLLFSAHGKRFAMPVSEVHGIHRYHTSELRAVPATLDSPGTFTIALLDWNGRTVGVLDADRVFRGSVEAIA